MHILICQLVGTELYAASLANALSRKGHQITALIADSNHTPDYFADAIDVISIAMPVSPSRILLKTLTPTAYLRVRRIVHEVDPDVVHITQSFLWTNLPIPLFRGYPVVVTDHEPSDSYVVTLYGKTLYKLLKPYTRRTANALIVHGQTLKEELVERGIPESRVHAVPHGVYDYYTRWGTGDRSPTNTILFFGLIAEYKGVGYLIDAFRRVREEVPDATLLIAGKGNIGKYSNEPVEEIDGVELHNHHIEDEDVASYFERADVVALPYIGGSQSGVLTIAYAFRTPVVTTNVGSIPEVVDNGETGFVVPTHDSVHLAEKLINVLDSDQLRTRMRSSIDKKVESGLTWERVAENTVDVYNSVN